MKSINFASKSNNEISNCKLNKDWTEYSDAQLVSIFAEGNDRAASILVKRYFAVAVNRAVSVVHDYALAEDIANEASEAVLESIKRGSYAESGSFKSYLLRSVKNKAVDYVRAAKARQTTSFEDYKNARSNSDPDGESFDLIDDGLEAAERKEALLTFIEDAIPFLPKLQGEVMSLKKQGLHFKEISEMLGISINTATSCFQYARRQGY